MRKEIIIRVQPESDKCHRKALKVAASVRGKLLLLRAPSAKCISGVESVSVTGREKDLLVIGDVDEVELIKKLQEKVGEAEMVELRTTLPGDALLATDVVVTLSPFQQWRHSTPGRSVPGGGRIECPVSAAARQQAGGCYRGAPSPLQLQYHHHPSPMAGQASYGYAGSSYALAVARNHPANYSPMIARHDCRAVGRPHAAGRGGHGRDNDGGGPNCCSIL